MTVTVVSPLPHCSSRLAPVCFMKNSNTHACIISGLSMRVPNSNMKCSRCVQAPSVEDFTYALRECTVFSKLDLKSGYHQLAIDEASAKVSTFSTPWGNYRLRRLVFGARSSQDVFDQAMYRIFGDIANCKNQRDDIIIGGKS